MKNYTCRDQKRQFILKLLIDEFKSLQFVMAKVHCSILQVSNRILRDRIISSYFENTKGKCNTPAREFEKLGNCVKVYHVPPYLSREMRKSYEINGFAKPQNKIQINVAILLVNLDGVHVVSHR